MVQALIEFVLAAAAIIGAAVWLTRFADRVAELTGFGRLLVGTVLLAALTSLPEISVGVAAARQGHDDIAVGNVVGSSLMNLLILAVLDLTVWSRGRMLSRISSAHALSATMSMLLTGLAALALTSRAGIQVGPMGLGSLAILVAWLLGVRIVFFDERFAAGLPTAPVPDEAPGITVPKGSRRKELLSALAGCGATALVILFVSPYLSDSAARMAQLSGLGDTFVGSTLVALATSLPEATAALAAVRMGQPDLAIGNLFGSNGFNMVILAPVDAAGSGPLLSSASPTHAITCLWAMVVTAVAVIGQLYHVERRRKFVDPDAWLMIVLIGLALASTYGA